MSADDVLFYVHSTVLRQHSQNEFNRLIPSPNPDNRESDAAKILQESSEVLNVLLHSLYGISCERFAPSFASLQQTVKCMTTYGLDPQTYVSPSSHLYDLLLAQAPALPLPVYALAAQFNLLSLATATSSHLLALDLSTISDEWSEQIGTLYLKKLFFLHLGRREALKRCLADPPRQHSPTDTCSMEDQRNLASAWITNASTFVWEGRVEVGVAVLEGTLTALGATLHCSECKQTLQERVQEVVTRWALVKVLCHRCPACNS